MSKQEYHCCLCNKVANLLFERRTLVEHKCVSIEYKFYCSEEHYIQSLEEPPKQLNSKKNIILERLTHLPEHIGNKESWNDFLEL